LSALAGEVIKGVSEAEEIESVLSVDGTLAAVEQDVLRALLNLGCARPQAEAALRRAKATAGITTSASTDFERLFRRALELVR
jgi:Holliday junction DNA helicase RuvA